MPTPETHVCDTDDDFVQSICAHWPNLDPEQVRRVGRDRQLLYGLMHAESPDQDDAIQETLNSYFAREHQP